MNSFMKPMTSVVSIAKPALQSPDKLAAIVEQVNLNIYNYLPVAGWIKMAVIGIIEQNIPSLLTGIGISAIFIIIVIAAIMKLNADYYEDVLVATEAGHSAITAQKEGRTQEALPRHIKVGKTGINKGWGANIFYYKHYLENRRAKVFIFDTITLIFVLASLFFAFIMRENGILPGFFFSCYMMFFSTVSGRWTKELLLPYVYMIPQSPFQKLIYVSMEQIDRTLRESVIIMVIMGLIVGVDPLTSLSCALARTAVGVLFLAANAITERLFGGIMIKTLQVFLYMLVIIIAAVPAVVLAILIGKTLIASMLIASACMFIVSAIIFFCCRNVLTYAELNYK